MSTLRTPRLDQVQQSSATTGEQQPVAPQPSPPRLPFVLLGVVFIVGVFGISALLARRGEPPTTTTVPTPAPVIIAPVAPVATPVDACVQVTTTYRTIVADLERQLKWQAAANTAASAVASPEICDSDRSHFARAHVNDSLEALYALPFSPTKAAQQEAVDAYQSIKRTAQPYTQLYDVTLPNALRIGQRASQSGLFLLALHASSDAYAAGGFQTADISLLRNYISNMYNYGYWLTQSPTAPHYDEGLRYLVTSYRLEQQYSTGQAEAYMRLRELLGPDQTTWPEPIETPLL